MIGKVLKWLLIGYDSITSATTDGYNPQYELWNLLRDNIYPNVIPQHHLDISTSSLYPAIVYNIEKTDPDKVKEVRAPNNRVSIELNVIDENYSTVNQISTLVINHLHRYKNSYNSNDSDSIGYGTTEGDNRYGRFAPASTGDVQYVGGVQIQELNFEDVIETYDDKLNVFKNILNFDMVFIDDLTIWGADVMLKFSDLNLMATNINSTDDPLYTQPLSLDNGVNYLFTPSVLAVNHPNISSTTLDGIYENFNDPSGTSSTNRPTIKKSTINPPKYNGNNYLEFGTSDYLLSSKSSDRLNRKYKEVTFFTVMDIPDSYTSSKSVAVLSKRDSTTDPSCTIFFSTVCTNQGNFLASFKFIMAGTALEDDGSGGEIHRGFTFQGSWISVPFLGILTNVSMENPFYFSVSFKRREGDNTRLDGEFEWITSSDLSSGGFGDVNEYYTWNDTATTTFKEYFFNFETVHSDITNYDTRGAATVDLNDSMNLYDFVMWPESLTFGSNKYLEIKRQIIEKHNMYKRTSN